MPVETPAQTRALPTVSANFLQKVRKAQEESRGNAQPAPTPTPAAPETGNPTQHETPPPQAPTPPAAQPPAKNPPETAPAAETATPPLGDPQAGFREAAKTDKETNLANLRKAREEAEARAEAAERQVKELQGKIPTDYEQLQKDRDLLIREIEMRDVTASPRFKEKYDKPLEQQLGQISKTLSLTDVKPEDFTVVVQMPESKERTSKLAEMIGGLDPISAGKVTTAISRYDELREARAQEVSNPSEAWQMAQRERQEALKTQQEHNRQSLQKAFKTAEEKIPWFKEIEGNEAWNQKIRDVKARATSFWEGGHTTDELSQLTLSGVMTPLFVEALALSQQENERLNQELSELRGAKPRTGAGSAAASGSAGAGGEKRSIGEIFRRAARGQA